MRGKVAPLWLQVNIYYMIVFSPLKIAYVLLKDPFEGT